MGDSVKKYEEMLEEQAPQYYDELSKSIERVQYIYVLDYSDGQVYRYDISPLCNDDNKWNPESESCESFLIGAGHNLGNIEWMTVTNKNGEVNYGN